MANIYILFIGIKYEWQTVERRFAQMGRDQSGVKHYGVVKDLFSVADRDGIRVGVERGDRDRVRV